MDWNYGGGGGGGAGGGGGGGGGAGGDDGGGGAEGAGPGTPLQSHDSGYNEADPHVPPETPADAVRPPPPPPAAPSTPPKDPPSPAIVDVNPGQDNHVSPPVGAAFTDALPAWVLEVAKTEHVDVEVTYPKGAPKSKRTIKLYWFRFLGLDFMSGNVKGVNRGMLKRLLRAQEDLYRQYREQMGAPASDSDDQKKFRTWCQAKESIGGQGPRGGGNHRDGSAIDIEYTASPWVPIYNGGRSTGETHNGSGGAANDWSRINVWEPCIEIYNRAALFCFGRLANPRKASDAALSYDAFKEAHDALVSYLSYRYPKGFSGDLTEASEVDFIVRMKAERDTVRKSCKLYLKEEGETKPKEIPFGGTSGGDDEGLRKAFAQIEADRKVMRYGMVIGKLKVENNKIDESATNFREPCKGFLMIKKEVVLSLLKTGLRWGGQDFGDMMHFDMGLEILNEFRDASVAFSASRLLAELGETSDAGLQKVKEAAEAVKNAAEMAGAAANAASLADNVTKEEACWAAVSAAKAALDRVTSAKNDVTKAAKSKSPSTEKAQKALDAADAALTAAKKAEGDAKQASAM